MSTRIILVRHAETAASIERRFVGSTDIDLTDNGFRQAEALAQRFRQVRVDVMHVSPLRRCQQTAAAITSVTGRKATTVPDLRECGFGIMEGLTFAEAGERFGDDVAKWFGGEDTCPPEGESWAQVDERVKRWFDEAGERYKDRTVLAVTHGGPIIRLARHIAGGPHMSMIVFEVDPASVTIVQSRGNMWRIRLLNDTTHLRDPLLAGGSGE